MRRESRANEGKESRRSRFGPKSINHLIVGAVRFSGTACNPNPVSKCRDTQGVANDGWGAEIWGNEETRNAEEGRGGKG